MPQLNTKPYLGWCLAFTFPKKPYLLGWHFRTKRLDVFKIMREGWPPQPGESNGAYLTRMRKSGIRIVRAKVLEAFQ